MAHPTRSFCRGFGSVMEIRPRTNSRHVFIADSNADGRNAVTDHFHGCWRFVTDSMREAALKVLSDDGLVQELSEYFKQCPTPTHHRHRQDLNGHQENCRLHESQGQLDLCFLDRWTQEAPKRGMNGQT